MPAMYDRIEVRISQEQKKFLKEVARKRGLTVSELLRESAATLYPVAA